VRVSKSQGVLAKFALLDGSSKCRRGRGVAEHILRLGKMRKEPDYVGGIGGQDTVEFQRQRSIDIRGDSR
jgi:hypothetical protein